MQRRVQPGPACRSSDASVLTALMTAVEPQQPGYLSHSDAAAAPVDRLPQRQDPRRRSSSAALARPAAQRPGPEHRVHQARSAPRPPELRAGVPGRPVLYAVPPGHLTLSAAPPASPTADSSHLPYRHRSFIDTGLSLSPKPFRRLERSSPTISTCFTYPQPISRSDVPHTSLHFRISFAADLTAATTWNGFRGCDDEHPQAHRRVGVRLSDPAGRRLGRHREGPSRVGVLLHRTRRNPRGLDGLGDGRYRRPEPRRRGDRGADAGACSGPGCIPWPSNVSSSCRART